jgi:hypothetical protein
VAGAAGVAEESGLGRCHGRGGGVWPGWTRRRNLRCGFARWHCLIVSKLDGYAVFGYLTQHMESASGAVGAGAPGVVFTK